MAELDEIVQNIILKGDDELLTALGKIGSQGKEQFEKITEAIDEGASGWTTLTNLISVVATALSTATVAMISFVEEQTEATQRTILLGEAFGASTAQVQGLESAFAEAGVSVQVFERFAQRLTTTIAQQWPEITKSVRTWADTQAESNQRVIGANIRVQESQNALQQNFANTTSEMAADNSRVQHSYVELQYASTAAAAQQRADMDSVRGAALSLEAAQQRLDALQGKPVSDADKEALQIKEAQLDVDKARETQAQALVAQQRNAAEAVQKQKDAEQAYNDAINKRAADQEKAELTRRQLENSVNESITARAKAEEAARSASVNNISAISDALKGIADGNKTAAQSIDLTQVSVQNLSKGIIAAASVGGQEPKVLQVLIQLSKTLHDDNEHLISDAQRLALVQRLSGQSMASAGSNASELLAALARGPESYAKFAAAAEKSISTTHEGKEAVDSFRDSLTDFNQALSVVNQNFAVLAAPALGDFFKALKKSLDDSSGALHLLVQGIIGIGNIIGAIGEEFTKLGVLIEKAFNLEKGTGMLVILAGLAAGVVAFASAWASIPIVIGTVIVAIGLVRENWDKMSDSTKAWVITGAVAIAAIITALAGVPAAIVAIGVAIVGLIAIWDNLSTGAKVAIGAIIAIVGGLIILFGSWPAVVAVVVVALAALAGQWDKIKEAANAAWEWLKPARDGVDAIWEKLKGLWQTLKDIKQAAPTWLGGGGGAPAQPSSPSQEAGLHLAGGGEVDGPGTTTSDSIFAKLSRGEFVVKAAAVQAYGSDLFHRLNSMSFPGFAMGGLVPSPVRTGGGGTISPTSVVNLTIGDRTFEGLRGSKAVVDDLASYAIGQQTSSAGRRPSWDM